MFQMAPKVHNVPESCSHKTFERHNFHPEKIFICRQQRADTTLLLTKLILFHSRLPSRGRVIGEMYGKLMSTNVPIRNTDIVRNRT